MLPADPVLVIMKNLEKIRKIAKIKKFVFKKTPVFTKIVANSVIKVGLWQTKPLR